MNKKIFNGLFAGLCAVAILATSFPFVVSAQAKETNPSKSGFQLIPCDGVRKQKLDSQGKPAFETTPEGGVGKPMYIEGSEDCDFGQLKVLFNNILSFLLYLSMPLVLGMIMYTGFAYITANGDVGKLKKAKSMLIPVALGIFWILAGFIVVKTVLNSFLADDIGGEKKETFINRFLGN